MPKELMCKKLSSLYKSRLTQSPSGDWCRGIVYAHFGVALLAIHDNITVRASRKLGYYLIAIFLFNNRHTSYCNKNGVYIKENVV